MLFYNWHIAGDLLLHVKSLLFHARENPATRNVSFYEKVVHRSMEHAVFTESLKPELWTLSPRLPGSQAT